MPEKRPAPDAADPREMLARLVAFPTISTASSLDIVGFVEDHLAGLGIPSIRVLTPPGPRRR